ncbi:ABC transporter ATP-binding protein [Streptomyces sp. NPDC093109]|uniref:ABC transporter ATP-binding protein n=1 Tax=Streptomyces sp. NPDC093109 TaxID=3154977 RepID=UPI00344F41BF
MTARAGNFTLGPLDFTLPSGKMCCLIGPNGAGKTTLIRCLLGLLTPEDGTCATLGHWPRSRDRGMLRGLGYVPDDHHELVLELSAFEYWKLCASVHAETRLEAVEMLDRATELAEQLEFTPPPEALKGYSHGMCKKTQLVAALLHSPRLLILDEPRNGLDPLGISRLEEMLRAECARGTTVLAASHDLYWAERTSDLLLLLSSGRLIASGSPSGLCLPGEAGLAEAFFRLLEEHGDST